MSEHTPGPWRSVNVERDTVVYVKADGLLDHQRLADVHSYPTGLGIERAQRNANAQLMAAAPDLLEALTALAPYMDAIVCYASTMGEHEPNRLVFNANAAIAKATKP